MPDKVKLTILNTTHFLYMLPSYTPVLISYLISIQSEWQEKKGKGKKKQTQIKEEEEEPTSFDTREADENTDPSRENRLLIDQTLK